MKTNEEILSKIQEILNSETMSDNIKLANIQTIFDKRNKYFMRKPWYVR